MTSRRLTQRRPKITASTAADRSNARNLNPVSSTISVALPPDGTPIASSYDQLRASALNGDARAAIRLFTDLEKCKKRQLQLRTVNLFKPQDDVAGAPTGTSQMADLTKASLDALDATDALCRDVTNTQVETRGDNLRLAASLGDTEAMVCYAMTTLDSGPQYLSAEWFDYAQQWKIEAPSFVQRAFDAGQPDVLPLLIEAYAPQDNSIQKTFQYSDLVDPNQSMAYGLALLYEKLVPAESVQMASLQAKRLSAGLTEEQIRDAQSVAEAAAPQFAARARDAKNAIPCSALGQQ